MQEANLETVIQALTSSTPYIHISYVPTSTLQY